jgi:hypothetical protein
VFAVTRPRLVDALLGALLLLAALGLYVRTLAPGLLRGDGAEFQALAVSLGLAHPTGYAVYLLAAHLFTLLPFESPAYRVNLFSAVAAALALVLLYFGARRLGCRPLAALAGPLALGVGRMFWWHAVMAETYALALALQAAILLLLLHARHGRSRTALFGAGLLGGLGLGVHGTTLLLAPAALLYLALMPERRRSVLAASGGAVLGVVLALGAFVLLDLRDAPVSFYNSTMRPWLARWALESADVATTGQRIWFLLSARQFQGAVGRDPLETLPERAVQYWQYLVAEWAPAALVLMVLGPVWLLVRRERRPDGLLLLLAAAIMIAFVLNYDVYDVYVFYLPGYVPLALLACAGAEGLLRGAGRVFGRLSATERNEVRTGGSRLLSLFQAIVAATLIGAVLWPALPTVAASLQARRITMLDGSDFAWYPYPVLEPEAPRGRGLQLAALVEDDALVYVDWGTVFVLYYVAHIEQGRTGITVHEWFDPGDDQAVQAQLIATVERSIAERPVYLNHIPPSLADRYGFVSVGDGLLFRVRATR